MKIDRFELKRGLKRAGFYAANFAAYAVPNYLYKLWWKFRFSMLSSRQKAEARQRCNYYLFGTTTPDESALQRLRGELMKNQYSSELLPIDGNQEDVNLKLQKSSVGQYKYPFGKKKKFSTYFFDLYRIVRMFPKPTRFSYIFGDRVEEAESPAFTKARRIGAEQARRSLLMPMNTIRHFIFVKDPIKWKDKVDKIVFRNYVKGNRQRSDYLQLTFNNPLCDSREVGREIAFPGMAGKFMPIGDMLKYKFVATLEGNDVATALKWVMSSNSIAVMPRPSRESWYMEGTLIPDYHYIEIAEDFSNLEEKIKYYIKHPDKAEEIIENAHRYSRRFRNKVLERYTAYLVASSVLMGSKQRQMNSAFA